VAQNSNWSRKHANFLEKNLLSLPSVLVVAKLFETHAGLNVGIIFANQQITPGASDANGHFSLSSRF